ncbi:MAG: Rpp14/Pop5 family protein [Thermoproteota archaeon]|nr:Rpp14/Pop5 family protein [Thermoproteota archaeon]
MRTRYLALEILSEHFFNKWDIINTIRHAVVQLFGEYGASQINLYLIEYDVEKNQAIVRCSHKAVEMARAAIASVTKMLDHPVAIQVLSVSGTLKALRRKLPKN